MRIPILVAASLALIVTSGCVGLPGEVSTTQSKFDGEQQIQIDPGWIKNKGMSYPNIKVGGFWSNKAPGYFALEVVYAGTEQITGLGIRIDDQIHEFTGDGKLTRFEYEPGLYNSIVSIPGHAESSKRFVVPIDFIDRMVAGKEVIMRLNLDGQFVEGEFNFDQISYARPGFRKALPKIHAAAGK